MTEKIFIAGETWKVSCPNCNCVHVLNGQEPPLDSRGWFVGTSLLSWSCAVCGQANVTAVKPFAIRGFSPYEQN